MSPLAALTARLFRLPTATTHRSTVPSRRSRLALHALESRTAPAVFTIANGDITGLANAITTSNSNNQSDTINLAAGGTYTFSTVTDAADGGNALPSILTDTGLSSNTLTINGNGATFNRASPAGSAFFRYLREAVASGTLAVPVVTVNAINFTGGQLDPTATNASGTGGAVFLAGGSLTIADCIFTGNQAPQGGAVGANQTNTTPPPLNLTRDTFTQNSAVNGAGGAVYSLGSSTLTVTNCTLTGNTASAEGGALRVQTSNTTTTVTGSTFANNTANGSSGNGGGAIFSQGTTNIDTTTVRDNVSATGGGGVWVQGTLTVTNSTVSGNRANGSTAAGGGIFVQGNFTLQDSTVYGNRAGSGGGIAYALGGNAASITFSTVTGNSAYFVFANGGGIQVGGSNLSLGDSVVAGNVFEATATSGTGPDVGGTVNSAGYNFIGNGTGATITGTTAGNQVGTAAAPLNPQLGPLQANGGPTLTSLPLPGSPLIDAGDPSFASPPATDQRGQPRVLNGRVDIGATEFGQLAVAAVGENNGAVQRSMVTSVQVTFDAVVTIAPGAFTLTFLGGPSGGTVNSTVGSFTISTATVGGVTVATLSGFSGTDTSFGSLADGRYSLTVNHADITAGGVTMASDVTFADSGTTTGNQLYRLSGDGNGDRAVNGLDITPFVNQFGMVGTGLAFDVNGDGAVNGLDITPFVSNFGKVV